jgi:hypothetical protein
LREEIAGLRARLNALTTLPLSASGPLPLQAEPDVAAKTPLRQMPLFGPVHGSPLPQVDHESSSQAKVGLYRTLFAGRSDVYAYRWENAAEGTKGWAPKRRPGTTRDNPEYLSLTDEVISAHLTKENPAACGLYVMLPDSTCRLLVCDFDGGTWRLDAAAYAEAAAWAGVPAAVEISRSGDGAHVWTFFSEPVAAADARAMGAALLHEAMAIRGEMDIESYDRLFPAQDYLPRRGFGNLIALPLEGRCRSIPARRWLGLTATPKRADGREEIMFMHCGQVRHKIPSATDLIQELHVHPTATTIRDDIDSDTPGILQSIIIPALVSDRIRTAQIIDDVVHGTRRGRNCLVMAGRTEHVDQLAAELNARGLAPMVLHGSISPGKRRVILKQLADWDPVHAREPLLLAATASYIGEGFDCPALDTLFLCSPSSSESIITQNVGRIMRDLPGKTTVEVHDYADTRVPC